MNTIYKPQGRAGEYGEYALNIYDGCPHGCVYCYVPNCLHKDRKEFHASCKPRPNIVEEVEKRLAKGDIKGEHIFLCFTCDPFPYTAMYDHGATLKIIDLIHDSGNYVQILTKGCIPITEMRHILPQDKFGITISCGEELAKDIEPCALPVTHRLRMLRDIKECSGCKTFVSCEPVYEPEMVYHLIKNFYCIDEYKIGKLNYVSADNPYYPNINWGEFGKECERLCKEYNRNYYIKESLRREMK